ncbi:MAG: GrpB family protein [Chloroflexota bacterium]
MNQPTTRRITIIDYHPAWVEEFAVAASTLRKALGDLALRVDHIGSTAVPGLPAKDIIDVQVTVRDITSELETAFQEGGYQRNVGITHDHQPPGTTPDDARNWEKQFYNAPSNLRPTNIHARRAGSVNGRYALLFRDYARAHPLAAAAYARTKKALAAHGETDWDLYYDVKDPVCDIIMAAAEDWAAATDWRIEHFVR